MQHHLELTITLLFACTGSNTLCTNEEGNQQAATFLHSGRIERPMGRVKFQGPAVDGGGTTLTEHSNHQVTAPLRQWHIIYMSWLAPAGVLDSFALETVFGRV